MIDDISGVTSKLVGLALDACTLRHNVIANNIANVHTSGYVPRRLSFDQHIALNTAGGPTKNGDALLEQRVQQLHTQLTGASSVELDRRKNIELDVETVKMSENLVLYQALLEGLAKHGSLLHMAISGGRS